MKDNWLSIIDYSPRPEGSFNECKVREFLKQAISEKGFVPIIDTFSYPCWELLSFSGLEVLHPNRRTIEAYPAVGSGSSEEVRGHLQFVGYTNIWDMYKWPRYAVVNMKGEPIGYITARPDGEALSQTLLERWDLPHLIVGETAHVQWKKWLNNNEEIEVVFSIQSKTEQRNDGENIKVSIPGRSKAEKMVIGAHYDSMYNTRGAYDNASGTAVVLNLLKKVKTEVFDFSIDLLFFGGEELLLAGSSSYVEKLSSNETKQICLMLNIDGIGRGETLEWWSSMKASRLHPIIKTTEDLFPGSEMLLPAPPGSDHSPFMEAGVEVLMLTINDQEIIHTKKDEPEETIYTNMEKITEIVWRLFQYLQKKDG